MNGQELSAWASSEFTDIKILLTTAKVESQNKQAEENKKLQLLEKPYSKSELIQSVFSCIN